MDEGNKDSRDLDKNKDGGEALKLKQEEVISYFGEVRFDGVERMETRMEGALKEAGK